MKGSYTARLAGAIAVSARGAPPPGPMDQSTTA